MPRKSIVSMAVLFIAILLADPARAEVLAHEHEIIRTGIYNSCTNEVVDFADGSIHVLIRSTESTGGTFHLGFHLNYQGVSGIGRTTGNAYSVSLTSNSQVNTVVPGSEYTFVNHVGIVTHGKSPNGEFHFTLHVTFNAAGEVTSFVDNFRITCKKSP